MSTRRWRISTASAVGTSHLASGAPCQDACQASAFECNGEEVLIIACADGAGSAPRSDEGARWACDEVMLVLRERAGREGARSLDETALVDAIASARELVIRNASDFGVAAREFASTLLVAAATPERVLVAQLGDGVVVAGAGQDLRVAVTVEQELLNVTDFLVDSDAMEKVKRWSAPADEVDSIAVSTDGLVPVLVDQRRNAPHPPMFGMLFGALRCTEDETEVAERLQAFIRSEQVCQRTDDDKTLVLAHRGTHG